MTVACLRPDWPTAPGVQAAFTRRRGGCSQGPYASLNLAQHVGDAPAQVQRNRARVRECLALPAEPHWLQQVHGARVVDLDKAEDPSGADGAVTRAAGQVLAIQVADCLAVLLVSADGQTLGAAHAGWRGLAAGVLEATVSAMAVPPAELCAWLAPAISQAHFEVGAEVREAFLAADPVADAAFEPNARGRWQCDLAALARQRLGALGVRTLYGAASCTFANPADYFSFRRDGVCGRMAALLWRL